MIKNKEINPIKGDSFRECKLGRKKYAEVLTNMLLTYSDGFVLAINNKWGTGKTTFIKMWEQDLKDKDFQTIYFNAWENDFENNALTAIMGELKSLDRRDSENFQKALKNASLFTKNLAPALIKAVAKKYIGEDIENIAESFTRGIADIFENDVNEYNNKKESIKEFKENLKNYITETWQGKPVIFIVDELDRCRPDYAVSVLEQIKHFFSVPNVIFVLSIDKEQLGYAIKGVYGNNNIDTDEYLRRFIDVEYSIPDPEPNLYVNYLYNYYNFDSYLLNPERIRYNLPQSDKNDLLKISNIFFNKNNLSLRQQNTIFSHAKLTINAMVFNHYIFPAMFIYLIMIRIIDKKMFNRIKDKLVSISELQEYFITNIKVMNLTSEERRYLLYSESQTIFFYNEYVSTHENRTNLIEKIPNSMEYELKVKSLIDNSTEQNHFLNHLVYFNREFTRGSSILESFFSKMELLEGFKN